MSQPNQNELIFYTNTPLDDADYESNWLTVIGWLTDGTSDLNVNQISAVDGVYTNNVTVTGNVTAGNYFGDGSNLTGINVSGSGVAGIQTLEIQSFAEKITRGKIPSSQRANIVESFVTNDNFTAALQSSYTANQTLMSMTLNNNSYAPLYTELIAENTDTGAYYTFQCTSLGSDSYPTVIYNVTPVNANLTAGSCNIYRSTLSKNLNMSAATIDTSKTGNSLLVQTVCTPEKNLRTALSSQTVDWQINGDLPLYELSRTSGDLTTSTFKLVVNSDVSSEFITSDSSGTEATGVLADRNKVVVAKSLNSGNGSVNLEPLSDGGIFTLTSVAYSTGYLTLTVTEDTSTVIDSDIIDKNVTYTCSPLYFVPKLSCVTDNETAEDFTEVTPSIITNSGNGISYPSYVHSHWKLNELSGNAINARQASGAYDLTQVGTVPSTAGKLGNARGVFSTSNYFKWSAGGSAATVYDGATFVVDGWFKTSVTGANQCIIGKFGVTTGWKVKILTDNKLAVYRNETLLSSGSTYTDGNWHYFCWALLSNSVTADKSRLYVDGANVASGNGGTYTANTADFTIGIDGVFTENFQGLLDSIAYWSTVPSTWAEVEAIVAQRYANGLGREYGIGQGLVMRGEATAQSGARLSGKTDILIPVSTGYQNLQNIIISPR